MGVDQQTLEQYITDVAGDDAELAKTLRERLGTNEKAATNFVGGYMRNQDYTKKTQALATEKQQLTALQTDYEARLSQADADKDKIMRDLANERISASRAQALLKTVKEAYSLTDSDLPGIEDIKATAATGRVVDTSPDLDQRFTSFKEQIFKEFNDRLIPEISGLAILPTIWNEIAYEHEKLTGKRLSDKEQKDILAEARKTNTSLVNVWQDKYEIPDKRLAVRDADNEKRLRAQWDDEQAKKNQEMALRGIRPESNEFALADRQSPIFKRDFNVQVDHEGGQGVKAPARTDAVRERTSGAERAAAKFQERARNGQLGQPLAPQKTA